MSKMKSSLLCCLFLAFAVQMSAGRELGQKVHGANENDETNLLETKVFLSSSSSKEWCRGWMTNVESHNIRGFQLTPLECYSTIKKYMEKGQYFVDLDVSTSEMWTWMTTLEPDGQSAAVMFDIDETLLSNAEILAIFNYGSVPINTTIFENLQNALTLPALPSAFQLYHKLKAARWKLILVTARREESRASTEGNLRAVGYTGWDELILMTEEYQSLTAAEYKSVIRVRLEKEKGYSFKSCAGDQHSDCTGNATGERSWKFPNPMYYVG